MMFLLFYTKGNNQMGTYNLSCVYIKEQYFKDNPDYIKMLDVGNTEKQSKRNYLFLQIEYETNKLLIPLRTNLGDPIRKFGVIGFSVPSESKPNAGLDYRYILIVNNSNYIEYPTHIKIPASQQKIISDNYPKIENDVIAYVRGYISASIKNLAERKPKYKESTLLNFNDELGVFEGRRLRQASKNQRN